MRPPFLTGEHVYIRAMIREDKDCSAAWYDSEFPIDAERAEAFLKEEIQDTWAARTKYYAIVRTDDDQVVGGIKYESEDFRVGEMRVRMAPFLSFADADRFKADAIRLFLPWMRDEHEYMAVTVRVADDELECIATAAELDLYFGVRFRGYLRRPAGRVDLRLYQALNPKWEVVDA